MSRNPRKLSNLYNLLKRTPRSLGLRPLSAIIRINIRELHSSQWGLKSRRQHVLSISAKVLSNLMILFHSIGKMCRLDLPQILLVFMSNITKAPKYISSRINRSINLISNTIPWNQAKGVTTLLQISHFKILLHVCTTNCLASTKPRLMSTKSHNRFNQNTRNLWISGKQTPTSLWVISLFCGQILPQPNF